MRMSEGWGLAPTRLDSCSRLVPTEHDSSPGSIREGISNAGRLDGVYVSGKRKVIHREFRFGLQEFASAMTQRVMRDMCDVT